jgi:putative peptide zinc metalloprotease protein
VGLDAQFRELAAHLALGLAAVSGEAFLSSLWYRLAPLKPRLKAQARVRRHRFRGEAWYVVQDPASGRFNRFSPATWQLLGLMDGRRTMDEVWLEALEQLGDDTPSQDEVIRLLSQLHAADLLYCEANPDTAELFERFARHESQRRAARWKSPFSIRIPLWDPDRFLSATAPALAPLFGWFGALVYCVTVGFGVAAAALHWPELTENLGDRVLAADNLVLLWLCFPAIKLAHELGHAYATKLGGGEVHDMGLILLVFTPVPYVEASAANAFRSKWRRALVGAAGMLVEIFIAALAMFVWAAAEPGLLRAIAFNIMLIAGVSTVVFNANPLLRFDGYYILADLVEIPNLASRANRYWRYLAERYVFRFPEAEQPQLAPGERGWFLFYAPAALVYRMLVLVAIVFYVAAQWFFIGVALAIWGVATMFVVPLGKFLGYLLALPRRGRVRKRALSVAGAVCGVVAVVVLVVPAPSRIVAEGVVWLPEEANVRAGADGFVRAVLASPGSEVRAGAPLVESHDPQLFAQLAVLEARIAELEARLDQQRFAERVQADITRQELAREQAALDRVLERIENLHARSAVQGRFVLARADDLPGRFLRKGELIGYVTQEGRSLVRAVVSQDDVDLVRSRLARADVRLAERITEVYPAALVREVPAARDELPSSALSSQGGGAIAADPRDPKGGKAMMSTFQFDLELPREAGGAAYGGRAYVRFVLQPEPLAAQWYRRVRQAFLAHLNV